MAINKKLIHFNSFSVFNSKKLSANETNTAYRLGVDGVVTGGDPDILYHSICWIKDEKKMWTHGQLYDCSGGNVDSSDTYLADFTVWDLISGIDNKTNVECNIPALIAALQEHKVVLVAQEEDMTYGGAYVLNGHADDFLYFSIVLDDGNIIVCTGTPYNVSYIRWTTLQRYKWSQKQDTISDLSDIRSGASKGATAVQPASLATVATSGNYNDLSNKPTIPAAVTESTVSGWGFTKNTGTITGVSANGTSVATSGVANIPAATTSKYGVTKLSSATNSTSTTLAATASAVKSAYDLANGRQEKLVSGTNIKTINNTSILGSGNIAIDANIQAVDTQETLDDVETNTYIKYVAQTLTDAQKAQVRENIGVVEGGKEIIANKQGTDSIFVFANDSANGPLEPNKIYVSHFTVTFGIIIENIIPPTDLYAEYTIIFKTGGGENYEGTLMLPSYVLWANGTIPTLEAQTHYELSISATKIDNEYFYKAVLVPFKSV